jgi:hypothetical protein
MQKKSQNEELRQKLKQKILQQKAIRTRDLSLVSDGKDNDLMSKINDIKDMKSPGDQANFLKDLLGPLSDTERKEVMESVSTMLGGSTNSNELQNMLRQMMPNQDTVQQKKKKKRCRKKKKNLEKIVDSQTGTNRIKMTECI